MALQKNYTFSFTFSNETLKVRPELLTVFEADHKIVQEKVLEDVYFKIDNITGDKNKMSIHLGVYKDATKLFLLDTKIIDFVPSVLDSAANIFKQGYEHLKMLPEFADAIDC